MNNIQLIKTSAGMCTTQWLVKEFVDRVAGKRSGTPIAPEDIMVISSTDEEAVVLKEAITSRLLQEGLLNNAQHANTGMIATGGVICSQLLQEFPFEPEMAPETKVISEKTAERYFNMLTEYAIEETYKKLEPIVRQMNMEGKGIAYSEQQDWRDYIFQIVKLARFNDLRNLQDSATISWRQLQNLLGRPYNHDKEKNEFNRLRNAVEATSKALENGECSSKLLTQSVSLLQQALKRGLTWADWVNYESIVIGRSPRNDTIREHWECLDSTEPVRACHLKHRRFHRDMKELIKVVFECAERALNRYVQFKRENHLVDSFDQELKVLNLARNNMEFQKTINSRFKTIIVSNFHNSSPTMLALSIQLSKIINDAIWMGDQNQAVKGGYRSSSFTLIDAVVETIEAKSDTFPVDDGKKCSWVPKRALLDFTNAMFTPVLHIMSDKKSLNIPRLEDNVDDGGWIESWTLEGRCRQQRINALIFGIETMIKERDLRIGDIAILCRSNHECEGISKALIAEGLGGLLPLEDLLETKECTLVLAGLRYIADMNDTLAISEIVCLSNKHKEHEHWQKKLFSDPEISLSKWINDPLVQQLDSIREDYLSANPSELLDMVASALDIEKMVHTWGNVHQRLSNLNQLRLTYGSYQNNDQLIGNSTSLKGFLTWLYEEAISGYSNILDQNMIKVISYYQAMGKSFPFVVMTGLDSFSRRSVFGVLLKEAKTFNFDEPLAGRLIHFWPWPYGARRKSPAMNTRIEGSILESSTKEQEVKEALRLLYVGVTRAKDGLVIVREKRRYNDQSEWLNLLTDENNEPIISFGDNEIIIKAGEGQSKQFKATSRYLSIDVVK